MSRQNWRAGFIAVVAALALSACGGEGEDAAAAPPAGGGTTKPNTAPTITGTPATTVTAGTVYSFQPAASDVDSDPLTFSVTGAPAWANFNVQNGTLSGTPAEADVGTTADIVIRVSDGEATSSLTAFHVTIVSNLPPPTNPPAGNRAPTISGTPATSVQATSPYSFTPLASDPDGNSLTFSITNRPSWASFSTATGKLSGTPATTDVRTFSGIVITVSDGSLSAALPAFSISVAASANRAPVIAGTPATSIVAGQAYSFTPTSSDPDGQTLSFSIANKPSWASFNTSTGRLSGTPTSANQGTTSNIVITVSDGTLSASLAAFSITVTAATQNAAPVISGTPPTSVVAGTAYSFTPTASDADHNMLAFSISNKPSWATFSTATGALTGTPTTAQAGTYSNIVISVSDGTATTALTAFTITVTAAAANGTAALSWAAPTQNTDGSALNDLAGYRVYHGLSASALTDVVQVQGTSTTTYTFTQLAAGTHYFAVAAFNSSGAESALSAVGSKTIP
jgi:hypothetical protein